MKKVLMTLLVLAFGFQFLAAQNQPKQATQAKAVTVKPGEKKADPVEWNERTHNFGKIDQGVPATATFTFKNISDAPVLLTNVRTSCGCTVAKYTKEPVKPGEGGEVSATYNAARAGTFTKSVTVTVEGMASPIVLSIKGEVVAKAATPTKTVTPTTEEKK